ncbi:MAG: hypothetical protein KAT00_09550 [Planctomycetes bacterium]|nr:hypothetical protein [Planctomycetota bacterium]
MEDLTKEVIQRIDLYAEKLGVLATDLFQVMIAQQRVDVIWALVFTLVIGSIALLSLLLSLKYYVRMESKWKAGRWGAGEDVPFIIGLCIGGVALFFLTIGFLFDGSSIVGKLLNPTYYAVIEMRRLF